MINKMILLADIHANYPALQSVVDKEGRTSEYVVLGDIHGLLGYPSKTQTLVRDITNITLAGNHDKALFEYNEGHVNSPELSEFERAHTLSSLSDEQQQWAETLPYLTVLTRSGKRLCLCHAYPWPEKASGYEAGNSGVSKRDTLSVASAVSDDYDYVFHGHTHEQYDLDCAKFGHDIHFVNPGSLGHDNTYTTVNISTGEVQHKSVNGAYSKDTIREHIQSHLPDSCPPVNQWY